MLPFVFAEAARRQRDSNNVCNYNGSHSSHGAQNNTSQHYTTSDTVSYNQTNTMPLGDLEAGHGQSTHALYTPLPSYTNTPLPSTPPPSYNGLPLVPLPCAPAPNTLHPYVNNHQIPRRPVPRPARRRRCRDPCCGPGDSKCCTFLSCFLMITIAMVLFPLIAIRFRFGKDRKDGHEGQESRVHCRGVVIVAATAAHVAAHGGCG